MTTSSPGERFARGMANPLRASVMYPPDRSLFAPFRVGGPFGSPPADAVEATLAGLRSPFGLYVHVPFCEARCTCCDYATVPLARHGPAGVAATVDGVVAELRTIARLVPAGAEVAGLDLGGGTPGVLDSDQIGRILETVAASFRLAPGFEVSVETTPALAAADPAKWRRVAAAGVGRVSVGLQTASPDLLGLLNRAGQGADLAARGLEALRAAGFGIVNVDLMFGLPGLGLGAWDATLAAALSLETDVVTVYDTVYKNRAIAAQAARGGGAPTPAEYGAQYALAFERLTGAGFASRWGSVNFSRVSGRLGPSRYLEGRLLDGLDYVGVGLYASSLVGDTWRFGLERMDEWQATALSGLLAAQDLYRLPTRHRETKQLLLALSYGYLDAARFEGRSGVSLEEAHEEALRFLVARGLLRRAPDGFELVPGEFGQLPGIRAVFYPDDALGLLDLPVVPGAAGYPAES